MRPTHESIIHRRLTILLAVLLTFGLGAIACDREEPEDVPVEPEPQAELFDEERTYGLGQTRPAAETPGTLEDTTVVVVPPIGEQQPGQAQGQQEQVTIGADATLASICGLEQTRPQQVFFAFDSAELTAEAKGKLDDIAQCLSEGPLSGRQLEVELVGAADPRGPASYNEKLAAQRADSVAEYLTGHGVKVRRVETLSVGELDVDKRALYDQARKVEIRLVS